MAEKRMFTQKIIDSDAFLDMPLSAQALYFHLNMRADDDGFVNSPKRIARLVNASDDDLRLLLVKRFIIGFDSGVIVIKHWRMHNTLKSDRYKPTSYQEEFAALQIKDNKAYTERKPPVLAIDSGMETKCFQSGSILAPQNSIEQNRIEKDRLNTQVRASDPDEDDGFEEFWNAYPLKAGDIRQAYFEYRGVIQQGVDPKVLLEAVKWQAEVKEARYMGSAEKWLRNKGWTEKRSPQKSGKSYTTAADYAADQAQQKPVSAEELDALFDKI